MRKFALSQGDLYVSNDVARDWPVKTRNDAQEFFDDRLDLLFRSQPKFRVFIDLYGRLHNLNGYAVLTAHGNANGRWTYDDGEREFDVQKWIDKCDGTYSGLLLCVCNPRSYTPRIEESVLLIADRDINEGTGIRDDPVYSLLVPGNREIDSYTIDFEIEQLKKRLG